MRIAALHIETRSVVVQVTCVPHVPERSFYRVVEDDSHVLRAMCDAYPASIVCSTMLATTSCAAQKKHNNQNRMSGSSEVNAAARVFASSCSARISERGVAP